MNLYPSSTIIITFSFWYICIQSESTALTMQHRNDTIARASTESHRVWNNSRSFLINLQYQADIKKCLLYGLFDQKAVKVPIKAIHGLLLPLCQQFL